MTDAIRLSGMSGFLTATARAGKRIKTDTRKALRDVAEPIARDAEALAQLRISHIGASWARGSLKNIGAPWSLMRVGVSRSSVYVAPKQRGRDARLRRPNLAPLLMGKAMEPALAKNADLAEQAIENVLATVGRDWGS